MKKQRIFVVKIIVIGVTLIYLILNNTLLSTVKAETNSDIAQPFGYENADEFVSQCMLGLATDTDGSNLGFIQIAYQPVLWDYTYKRIAEGIIDDEALIINSTFWKNAGYCLNGDFVNLATWKQVMYETLIMDWLTYQFESDEFKTEFTKSSEKYAWKLTKYLLKDADIYTELGDMSVEDAMKVLDDDFYKANETLGKANDYISIYEDIKNIASTGIEFYKHFTKVLAVREACQSRINFLNEVKNISDDEDLKSAITVVTDKINMAYSELVFNEGGFTMLKTICGQAWGLIMSEVKVPYLKEIQLGKSGFDWLFNSANTSTKNLEMVILYIINSDFTQAYQNIRDRYTDNPNEKTASDFNNSYLSYVVYQAYASYITEEYIAEALLEGAWNQCTSWFNGNVETYNDLKTMLDSNISTSKCWYNLVGKYYNLYNSKSKKEITWYNDSSHDKPKTDENQRLSLGGSHSGYIDDNGSLYMWGCNGYGQLGNGTTTDSLTPIKIMDNVKAVSLGDYYSAAITNDSSLYMWGGNWCGHLGNGTKVNSSIPIKIMDNVKSVSLGQIHSAAITNDGSLYMWGDNVSGRLGDGTNIDSLIPIKIMDNVKSVSLGYNHSGAITEDGSLYMWGYNQYGQLGNEEHLNSSSIPIKVMNNVKSVSLGYNYSGAITNDGSLYMWGCNYRGKLGNGTTENSLIPLKIMDNVKAVSLGYEHSAAITEDGSLYMWGWNYYGRLGNGTTENSSILIPIKIMDNVKAVSLGYEHSAAITEDGSLYMWGSNYRGKLGNGTNENSSVPIKITIKATQNVPSGSDNTTEVPTEEPTEKPSESVTTTSKISGELKYDKVDKGNDGTYDYIRIEDCDKSAISVDIPAEIDGLPVTYIGFWAFQNCSSLVRVTIPDSVTHIGDSAFYNCSGLTSINIPNSVTFIGSSVFTGTALINNQIGIKYVDKWAVYCDKNVKSVEIKSGTKGIASSTFRHCSGLTSITIPESVMSIGIMAFDYCENLKSLTILNPKCKFSCSAISLYDNFYNGVICGYEDSTAQGWAQKMGCKFESLGAVPKFMISDIVKLQKWLVKSGELDNEDSARYDLNNDGKLNVFDVIILKRKLLK